MTAPQPMGQPTTASAERFRYHRCFSSRSSTRWGLLADREDEFVDKLLLALGILDAPGATVPPRGGHAASRILSIGLSINCGPLGTAGTSAVEPEQTKYQVVFP